MTSYDEVHHLEEEFVVIPPAMPNLLQDNVQKSEDDVIENEMLIASCENSEPSKLLLLNMRAKVMPMMLNSWKVRVLLMC